MCEKCEDSKDEGMVSVRTAVVLLAAATVAGVAAALQYRTDPSLAKAAIMSGIAFGAAFWWWHRVIRRRKGD